MPISIPTVTPTTSKKKKGNKNMKIKVENVDATPLSILKQRAWGRSQITFSNIAAIALKMQLQTLSPIPKPVQSPCSD